MTRTRGTRVLTIFTMLLFCAWHSNAQAWEDERYHLSMQPPGDWVAMSAELIAQTNAQVSHVTGRGFIAGYALRDTTALVFPYMLVQYKPYTALPEEFRPQAKLGEREQLELLYALVGAFRQRGALPDDIDTPQFIDRFGNDHARLTRLEDDGRFDFAGKIPHEVGQDPIRYHTHGVLGKDGIAFTTVFTIDDYTALAPLINNEMRTLAFANGYGHDALPDEAPATKPTETPEQPVEAEPVATEQPSEAVADTETEADTTPAATDTETSPEPVNLPTDKPDSTALIIILSLLGIALVAAAFIAWYVAHQKAQARRERNRARRERMQASQGTTQVSNEPRPASVKGRSRGSSDRHKHGTSRS